tara:strand:+ start:679 stop:1236 length:558 start_codon:yes stop_codon:yes gene_type:complete
MSAVLDFRELRDKVLAGEMEEDEEIEQPKWKAEIGNHLGEAASLGAVIAIVAGLGYDSMQETSAFPLFGSVSKATVFALGACVPLGYFLGAFSRGMEAQTQEDRYEKLLDDSQDIIEEQQEEIDSMEAEQEESEAEEQAEAENSYQYDYLSAEDSFFHGPSLGMGVSAFGQEGVLYRPKDTGMPW